MKNPSEHDYIQSYEQAVKALQNRPDDLTLKHQAVLALARTGALEFAISEYSRYGLDKVQNHEDIMALGGRLHKDLYLAAGENEALNHARDSAHKYEAAFQNTKGFYSGINSAAMAYIADMPREIINARIDAILDALPAADNLTAAEHYFVEATRAEGLLLKGEIGRAQTILKSAISFDPLNYAAHATTIKQFKMILAKSGAKAGWLSGFTPPRPLHFAGHIRLKGGKAAQDKLALDVTDHIQSHDIGFGFGALAAGSDILIAEALLSQGAELHIVLPCDPKAFAKASVSPFGAEWTARYKACLGAATSLKILSAGAPWPDADINRLAGQFAMGQAVLHAQQFSTKSAQLLIWDERKNASFTAFHATDWASKKRDQIILPAVTASKNTKPPSSARAPFPCALMRSDTGKTKHYKTAAGAIKAASKLYKGAPNLQIALHIDLPHEDTGAILNHIIKRGPQNSVLLSEGFAGLLAHFGGEAHIFHYAGLISLSKGNDLRCFALAK